MTLAANKYKTLVQNKQWLTPSSDEQKILALETKLEAYTTNRPPRDSGGCGGGGRDAGRGGQGRGGRGGDRTTPPWMTQHPGQAFIDAHLPKVVDGRNYWWCPKHNKFVMHKPDECRLLTGARTPAPATAQAPAPPTQAPTTALRVTSALLMNE